uniref:Shootin-1 n=1 Tax=Sus scrofa TaxID=9823 RepID=A0A8D0NGE3_PIG
MSMIRKRSHPSGSGAKKEKAAQPETGTEEVTDLKRQAVEEMMDRIKKGVHLRPVNQTARPKAKVWTLGCSQAPSIPPSIPLCI